MRDRIVVIARRLFMSEGVEAVSMRRIATEVGCSPMWLYRYFASKQDILWHIWDVFIGELLSELRTIKAKSPLLKLEKLALGYLDYWSRHPDRFLIVFLQKDLVPGATRTYLEKPESGEGFELFIAAVNDAQAAGEFGSAAATDVAHGLLCVMQGLLLNFITISEYPWGDTQAIARLTVRSYLAGLAQATRR